MVLWKTTFTRVFGFGERASARASTLAVLFPATMVLTGCITPVAPESVYRMTSDPEGAEIYVGTASDQLNYYLTTPFERRTQQSLNWSGRYFQARKEGYEDSEIHLQPTFMMGRPVHIHFDLEPKVTRSDLAPYRERDTVDAYYEFLNQYPDAPFADEVFEHLVDRIAERPDAADKYRELLAAYPEAMPLLLERQISDLESRQTSEKAGSTEPESPTTAEESLDAPVTTDAASGGNEAESRGGVSRSTGGTGMADADRERIERTLAQQSDELRQMADEYNQLVERRDHLHDQLVTRFEIWPKTGDSVEDHIIRGALMYCHREYSRRTWESDPWRMEEQCANELRQRAGPMLEEYQDIEDTMDRENRRHGGLEAEHRALQEGYDYWQETGVMDDVVANVLAAPEASAGGGGLNPAAGGDPDFAAAGGECARKDQLFDQMGARVTAAVRGSIDECDLQLANFLLHLFAYDLGRVCLAAGMPDYSAHQIEELRQSIQGMSTHMDQVDRRIGCRFDPTLLRAQDEWGHVPY